MTVEEELLAALLDANEALLEALRMFDDLQRVAMEQQDDDKITLGVPIDRTAQESTAPSFLPQGQEVGLISGTLMHSLIETDNPIPMSLRPGVPITTLETAPPLSTLSLAPTSVPHGSRSPTHSSQRSRASSLSPRRRHSWDSSSDDDLQETYNGGIEEYFESKGPSKPSEKALGKMKVSAEDCDGRINSEGLLYGQEDDICHHENDLEAEIKNSRWEQQVHYVYDAAAERTQQRIKESQQQLVLVNGLH